QPGQVAPQLRLQHRLALGLAVPPVLDIARLSVAHRTDADDIEIRRGRVTLPRLHQGGRRQRHNCCGAYSDLALHLIRPESSCMLAACSSCSRQSLRRLKYHCTHRSTIATSAPTNAANSEADRPNTSALVPPP